MKKKKIYILQKDLPDSKAGDEYIFIFPYGRIEGCAYYKDGNPEGSNWTANFVEDNPEWFKLKEEVKPTIIKSIVGVGDVFFLFSDNSRINISKERLSKILILNEENNLITKGEVINGELRVYSEKEYLEFGEQCFNSARENDDHFCTKYRSFSDFMNDKNK